MEMANAASSIHLGTSHIMFCAQLCSAAPKACTKRLKHLLHLLKRSVIQLMVATIWFHSQSPFYVMHSLIFLLKHIERARPLRVAQTDRTDKH